MSDSPVELELMGVERAFKAGFRLSVPYLRVPAGSTLALLGPSGAGKSTLLEIAGLLEAPDTGEVRVDGVCRKPRDSESRRLTAAVFQRPYLIKATVEENVAYGLKLRRVDRRETARRVSEILEVVGLSGFEKRSAGALSGGEAQRVALARALVLEPRLLMLDEPLSSLDLMLKRRMQLEFSEILRSRGITTVYVTHDHDEALVLADRIAIMRDGSIVAEGFSDEVIGVPQDVWTASFLGVEAPLFGVVESISAGLMVIRVGGTMVYASGEIAARERVRLAVRPEDVTVWKQPPEGTASARNRLDVTVTSLRRSGVSWTLVGAVDGLSLAASISDAAVRDLEVSVGDQVSFAFKATAVRVAKEEGEGSD
ncbi:MAG: ABC transporter ATP-binding protein [Actinomycetota bacterium]|jgi:molybdopterin-binding protein|nr:ABC transporter ATP-binding protein [Actinomycetota bacterium]